MGVANQGGAGNRTPRSASAEGGRIPAWVGCQRAGPNRARLFSRGPGILEQVIEISLELAHLLQRMFTLSSKWPIDGKSLCSNGVFVARAAFCA